MKPKYDILWKGMIGGRHFYRPKWKGIAPVV